MTLKEWRRKHHVSQETVAQKLGVHQSTVSKWETGEECPSLLTAESIRVLTGGKVPLAAWVRAA
jgi:DNA-binding XRE family transcriptional regulator